MPYTLKQIRKMTESEVEAAYQECDMYVNRSEFKQLEAARKLHIEKRLAAIVTFESCLDEFYRDIENGTYGIREGSEDNHCRLVWLAEDFGFDLPGDAQ